MRLFALVMLVGPTVLFVAVGVSAARTRPPVRWRALLGLAAISTVAWLGFAGLFQHETWPPCWDIDTPAAERPDRCPTVYGTRAFLDDEHPAGYLLLWVAFLVPAAVAGWRRLSHPLAIGAALAAGPGLLALWTAPRGDNDGLWALQLWMLPVMGAIAAFAAFLAENAASARSAGPRVDPDRPDLVNPIDRLTAFALDAVTATALLWIPVASLSHAGHEGTAAAVGIAISTAYLGVPTALRGGSPAQLLLRIEVVDRSTGQRLTATRAAVRSLLLVVEVLVSSIFLGLPLLADVITLSASGRSVVDRIVGTTVVPRTRAPLPAPVGAERP